MHNQNYVYIVLPFQKWPCVLANKLCFPYSAVWSYNQKQFFLNINLMSKLQCLGMARALTLHLICMKFRHTQLQTKLHPTAKKNSIEICRKSYSRKKPLAY